MNWKKAAEEDLRKYSSQKASLDNIKERLNILQDRFTSMGGATLNFTPIRGGGTPIEDKLLDNIVERERLKVTYYATKKLVDLMDKGLSVLDDKERRVLDLFYIYRQKNHVERLASEFGYEQAHVYRLKDAALYKYTISMYGLVEY